MENPDNRVDIARRNLRMAAALRDINPSEVSRQAGMSRNGLGQFISGRTTLSYANMLRVCDVLRIPIGLVHRADAITENRIRLYQLLERMPDHLAQKAVAIAQDELGSK
ncbi:helix-turn-helix domain-containing protein [Phaeobacter gallaeciensis]|uniref:helix-turn-helix domain-containing protein n=1 Tax=Phaeobacter gallaeciensis TaxID=60890 RepID=UPI00237F049E|nr:helix-turn-helix transcriptional regulator [Phaeobacter gallaeciensis]MDE4059756.1 helix-turn-helix transcriptional regulator [Phaeobacter gallaeciensis]MDE4122607.1 helix-turn-helix transcriptional regulator [Phaeobacter gallaeciensis]MDE4127243.1 helix-turn-helix transcriptional regulator [Phaeobacter gallaeciensis]